jgi:hypothetical protein
LIELFFDEQSIRYGKDRVKEKNISFSFPLDSPSKVSYKSSIKKAISVNYGSKICKSVLLMETIPDD